MRSGAARARKKPASRKRAVERDEAHVDDAGGAEIAEAGKIVLPVGVDERERVGQVFRRLVVVEDDDVEAEPLRLGDRLVADGAAIDGDDEARAARGEGGHRLAVGAVALDDAIGNVDRGRAAAGFEIFAQQRRARRAVDVVVAEDRDALAALDGALEARRRRLHVAQREGIGHQLAQGRLEIARDLVERDAAPREHARHQFALAARLRDGERARLARRVEPRAARAGR